MNMSAVRLSPRAPDPITIPDTFPSWARMAFADLQLCSRLVGSPDLFDEMAVTYLGLSGPEERCWPARRYWQDMAAYMGPARRAGLALARLWPEYLRFRQGRRSPSCTEIRKLLLSGGRPHGLDCVHTARCEHCRMFSVFLHS